MSNSVLNQNLTTHVWVLMLFAHSAAVVDEARQVATLGGIYNRVVVHSEQVAAADALLCVPLLAIVGHHLDREAFAQAEPSTTRR